VKVVNHGAKGLAGTEQSFNIFLTFYFNFMPEDVTRDTKKNAAHQKLFV
jgi:hypothetical protein